MDNSGRKRAGVRAPTRPPSSPARLRGNRLTTIDEAGRLKLPAEFRRGIEGDWGRALYLTSLAGECLWVYPLAVWQDKEETLLRLDRRHPAVAKFIARTSYFGAEAELDGQGRVLVPALLRPLAGLDGEVAVLGALDHLEVWANAHFRARLETEPLSPEELKVLAELGL